MLCTALSALVLGGCSAGDTTGKADSARLAALGGHPVVVDQWATWCGDCRYELAFFNAAAHRFGARVAFLGLDSQDNRGDAVRYIHKTPGGFPSISDPDGSLARSLGGGVAFPTTFFLDPRGHGRAIHIGAYPTPTALNADITRYALRKG